MAIVDLITLAKLAKELGMHEETGYLRELAREGKLPGAFQVGRAWLISRGDADRFKQERGKHGDV
jgi:hypothetical protein